MLKVVRKWLFTSSSNITFVSKISRESKAYLQITIFKANKINQMKAVRFPDGLIMPTNSGVNPSLTIVALAEYAMDQILPKDGE